MPPWKIFLFGESDERGADRPKGDREIDSYVADHNQNDRVRHVDLSVDNNESREAEQMVVDKHYGNFIEQLQDILHSALVGHIPGEEHYVEQRDEVECVNAKHGFCEQKSHRESHQ